MCQCTHFAVDRCASVLSFTVLYIKYFDKFVFTKLPKNHISRTSVGFLNFRSSEKSFSITAVEKESTVSGSVARVGFGNRASG